MNVYDFDGTIYEGDSTVDFWRYCIKKYPRTLRTLPSTVANALLYKLGRISIEAFKGSFFQFLSLVPNVQNEVKLFWNENIVHIQRWYLDQKQSEDIVVSASPEFLLAECCSRLNVRLLASRVDTETGCFWGRNCKGAEKVRRFQEAYPGQTIEAFYTDSKSDRPMAELAEQSFLVQGKKCVAWVTRIFE